MTARAGWQLIASTWLTGSAAAALGAAQLVNGESPWRACRAALGQRPPPAGWGDLGDFLHIAANLVVPAAIDIAGVALFFATEVKYFFPGRL